MVSLLMAASGIRQWLTFIRDPRSNVVPIPTPGDLPPLPIGSYGMPPPDDLRSSKCFEDPTLSPAWSCRVVMSGLYLTVNGNNDEYTVSLDCNHNYTLLNHTYAYGTQPPLVQEPVTLDLVTDKSEPNRGPAWFKMLSYTKTVILPERVLSTSGSSEGAQRTARHVTMVPGMANFKKKGVAQSGERVWVCRWPETYLELFIYAQQNSSFSNWPPLPLSSSSSQTSPSLSTTTTSGAETTIVTDLQSFPTGAFEGGGPGPEGSSKYRFGPQHAHASEPTDSHDSDNDSNSSSSIISSTPVTTTSSSTVTDSGSYPGPTDFGGFIPRPPYPRVVKLEERRLSTAGAPMPQCTQVEVQGPGQEARVVRHDDGEPVVVKIVEMEPFAGAPPDMETTAEVDDLDTRRRRGLLAPRDGSDMSPCGCMWFWT